MTLVDFDNVYLTAVADEHCCWEDIEQIECFDVDQSEVKIPKAVCFSNHLPSIRLRPTVIDDVIARWLIKPRRLDLNFDKSSADIEDQIIRQSISDGPENSPAALQCSKNGCLLSYVSCELRIHLLIPRFKPDELPLLYPATYAISSGGLVYHLEERL